MHRRSSLVLLLALAPVALPASTADDTITAEEVRIGHRARTLLAKPRVSASGVDQAEASLALRVRRVHGGGSGWRTLETDGKRNVLETVGALKRTGLYEHVEPDYVRFRHAEPNDPRFGTEQWSLANTGQSGGTVGADIRATAAWEIQREAPDVVVAVLDTGVFTFHEDMLANIWQNPGEKGGLPGVDDDRNGIVDDIHGIDATVPRGTRTSGDPGDDDGHGSHVAGIIGATGNNGRGIAGVAWSVKVMALKFLTPRGGSVSNAIAAIDYAIANGAHIINGSYGSFGFSQAEYDAIKRARSAGIIFVASAGNDSQEISEVPVYPAAYLLDNIVAVASTTRHDMLANYSTYGSGLVELAAPGSSIVSLALEHSQSYATMSGTSMAAPHVAGALALLKQRFPSDNYRALINRLLVSVDILPALENRVHTNGRLNVQRALSTTENRPFNDDFARRAIITGDANTIRSSSQFATLEPREPAHAAGVTRTLWWSWTAPAGSGKVTVTTAGSEMDTVIAVYRGTALEALVPVDANDDTGGGTTSSLTIEVTAGTTYAIAVGAKGPADGLMTVAVTSIPVNDAFARAQVLEGSSALIKASNAGATAEPGEPMPKTARGTPLGRGRTVWYRWVAPATRRFQVSVTDEAIDPLVAIYTGRTLDTLAEVTFSDDVDGAFRFDSLAQFTATAGVTYHFCVDVASGGGGRFSLSIADADWQALTEFSIYASPAIAPDGTLYVVDGMSILLALKPDGTEKWYFMPDDFDLIFGGSVAVGSDGTIYFGTYLGNFYAIDPAGKQKWRHETEGEIWAPPALGADGTIYLKSSDGTLRALNPDGTRKWSADVPGDTYSGPVVGADGTIYVASGGEAALYALNTDGTRKWRAPLGGTAYASPAIGADGTLYLGNHDGRFFAITADGKERWTVDTGRPLSGSAVIDARGYVYFGSYDKKLHALDAATGAKRWEYATGDIIRGTAPLIADDGAIYIGSDDGLMHVVNPDGKPRRTYATGGPIFASPALSGGRLYVASTDGKVYAFETGTNLARAPWPMHRHNLRRLGRVLEPLPGLPTITKQPVAATATSGTTATFSTEARVPDGGALTYQWRLDNVPLPGATLATLQLVSAQTADIGSYSVVVTGPGGATVSVPVRLSVTAGATGNSRLLNLAVRTAAGAGDRALVVGFVVGGSGTSGNKPLLLRGVGPTLATFGVSDALVDPKLELFAGGSSPVATNDNWSGDARVAAAAAQVGAFGLIAPTSKDAALYLERPAGPHTLQVGSSDPADNGTVLAEIYDATPTSSLAAGTPRLVNVSARTHVGKDGEMLFAGFVIGGTSSKTVMIRAIGPTLQVFGLDGVLLDPKLDVFQSGHDTAIRSNDNWGGSPNAAQIENAARAVGAFTLALESRDAVVLATLPPGSYTAQVSGVNNTTGAALVEVYEVP